MEIYFINICLNWLFKLYQEYLENLKIILEKNFKINVHIKIISEEIDYINEVNKIYNIKNKYIFLGNIGCVNNIYHKFKSNNFYFLNIEQMSHNSYYTLFRNLNNQIKVIDYSEENLLFHKRNYKNIFLLPPYFEDTKEEKKDIDIISFANNQYRRNILDNINNKFNIKYLDNVFGNERDNIFSRSKIYINIHCSEDHKTMELIRIVNLLKKKVIVITQNSLFKDVLFIKDNLIIFENNEQLDYLLNDILKKYNYYYKKIFVNNNLNYYDNYLLKHAKIILNN